jgi:hypothetical protein
VLPEDVPYGKIIETLLKTQQVEMEPEFPVPIPGIVILAVGPIFPAAFDSDFLKIVHEYLMVFLHEGPQRAGFSEIKVFPVSLHLPIPIRPRFFSSIGKFMPRLKPSINMCNPTSTSKNLDKFYDITLFIFKLDSY